MYCENRITHRVQEGDSLYSLSRKYHTTVTELILLNSGVNPYNLQVGMRLIVCPGEGYKEEKKEGSVIVLPIRPPKPQNPGMNNGSNAENSVEEMKNQMRLDWLNHIISVKFYLVSFFENLASKNAWKYAVGQNMDQIFTVFEKEVSSRYDAAAARSHGAAFAADGCGSSRAEKGRDLFRRDHGEVV